MKKYEKGLRVLTANIIYGLLVMATPLTVALIMRGGADVTTATAVGLGELGFAALFAWVSGIVEYDKKQKEKK